MKAHPERAAGDIKTAWEKNYGDEKDNCAQDGTRYSQDRTKGGAHRPVIGRGALTRWLLTFFYRFRVAA